MVNTGDLKSPAERFAGSSPASGTKGMTKKSNKFDFESDEKKTKYINEIIGFFQDERDEEIGLVAAENILDFFLQTMGEEIYKKAVTDCKKLLKERIEDIEIELDILSPNK